MDMDFLKCTLIVGVNMLDVAAYGSELSQPLSNLRMTSKAFRDRELEKWRGRLKVYKIAVARAVSAPSVISRESSWPPRSNSTRYQTRRMKPITNPGNLFLVN